MSITVQTPGLMQSSPRRSSKHKAVEDQGADIRGGSEGGGRRRPPGTSAYRNTPDEQECSAVLLVWYLLPLRRCGFATSSRIKDRLALQQRQRDDGSIV